MFSVSNDEERYYGDFATIKEAIESAIDDGYETFWVGECVPPGQPEDFWHAEDWLEHVGCQEDYYGDHAEDWESSSKDERDELEKEVRAVMAAWLDRHGLRPKFFNIENTRKYIIIDGMAQLAEAVKQ